MQPRGQFSPGFCNIPFGVKRGGAVLIDLQRGRPKEFSECKKKTRLHFQRIRGISADNLRNSVEIVVILKFECSNICSNTGVFFQRLEFAKVLAPMNIYFFVENAGHKFQMKFE